ncbi:hypothetical protein PoB_000855100 [Plakobranchus ocellatus]|uniref:Uncharacterized protein n=1 Tax=Plakobranchus ocellatus TaxID=259542 RepID=A0AAV3YI20_9GAST|nr:hypothetical protein PoB_000855100 [Plakobranchus ocellatus]
MQIASDTVDYQETARQAKVPIWNTFKIPDTVEKNLQWIYTNQLKKWMTHDVQKQEKTSTTSNLAQYRRTPAALIPGNVPYNAVYKT